MTSAMLRHGGRTSAVPERRMPRTSSAIPAAMSANAHTRGNRSGLIAWNLVVGIRESAMSAPTANAMTTAPAATSCAPRTRMRRLVLLEPCATDHLRPARQFRAHEGIGLRERHRRRIQAELVQAVAHRLHRFDDLRELGVEPLEHRPR